MKCSLFFCIGLAWITMTGVGYAQASKTPPLSAPVFRTNTPPLRSGTTGFNIAVFGGINITQNDSVALDPTSSTAFQNLRGTRNLEFAYPTDSEIGPVVGFKVGYVMDPRNMWVNDGKGEEDWWMVPAVEAEFLYTGYETAGTIIQDAGIPITASTNWDFYVFSVNGIMKFQYKWISPYIGIGPAMAYVNADESKVTIAGANSVDEMGDLAFGGQGIIGVEASLGDSWSFFTEYKSLWLYDAELNGSGHDILLEFDGMHIITVGIRKFLF